MLTWDYDLSGWRGFVCSECLHRDVSPRDEVTPEQVGKLFSRSSPSPVAL
jgi:hypothetical protein